MRPLDFYIENIEKQWICQECKEPLSSMRKVERHCTEQNCDADE